MSSSPPTKKRFAIPRVSDAQLNTAAAASEPLLAVPTIGASASPQDAAASSSSSSYSASAASASGARNAPAFSAFPNSFVSAPSNFSRPAAATAILTSGQSSSVIRTPAPSPPAPASAAASSTLATPRLAVPTIAMPQVALPKFTWATATSSSSSSSSNNSSARASSFGDAFSFATSSATYMAPAALAKQSEAADTLSANVSYSSPSSSSATLSSSSATSAGSHPSASSSSSSAAPSAAAAVSLIPTFVSKNPLAIIAHTRQRANPALRFVKQVPLEFADHIIPDFELGEATWALFLSLKYHLLHQTYLAGRCASIARGAASSSSSATSQPQMAATRLRLILILVDVDDCEKILEDLTVFANAQAWTIILAWSNQEVGRYLETFKAYEKKSADVLKERLDSDAERFHDCFAQVRSINKSDINTLAQSFGSFAGVCGASAESLALLPGLGPKKVQRLLETLRAPFRPDSAKTTLPSNVLMGTLDTSVLRRVATAPASVSASAAATTAQGGSLTNADASTEVLSSSSSSSEAAAFEHEPDSMRSIDSPKPDDSMASESI